MLRTLSLVLVLVTGAWALPAAAAEYESKELADAGTDYRQSLLDRVEAKKRQPSLIPKLRRDAEAEYKDKRYSRVVEDLERAISYGADDGLVWLRMLQIEPTALIPD